ncbi:S1C family serine protease [Bhargavaea ullalensis]|uniref:Serine protease Do n=1 Tax=Bhargavaea ullalensis TaxID=1265685 RepID=A0ABV2GCY7_9BACL
MQNKDDGMRKHRRTGAAGAILTAMLLQGCLMPDSQADKNNTEKEGGAKTETADGAATGSKQSKTISMDINTGITEAVEKTSSTVVGVTNLQTSGNYWTNSTDPVPVGVGSGVIYKKKDGKAYVVTNNHVVENATQLEVTLEDSTKVEGKLLGRDIWTDLAVIEMDDPGVKDVIDFGDSDALKRGETVIAIGNPLGLGFSGSVTVGVISGTNRSIPVDLNGDNQVDWNAEVLQTDAAINPGNSGGALINLAGQLVGINSMKISEETVEGIGLAIPINSAIPIIEDLEKHGEVRRAQMGVTLIDLLSVPAVHQRDTLKLPEDVTEGVVIDEVSPGSPAAEAGLRRFDVIVEMDGKKVANMIELRKHLYNEKKPGEKMSVTFYRDGKKAEAEMTL